MIMKRYQSPDERELDPQATGALFRRAGGRDARVETYDFGSSPVAGYFPDGAVGTSLRGGAAMMASCGCPCCGDMAAISK